MLASDNKQIAGRVHGCELTVEEPARLESQNNQTIGQTGSSISSPTVEPIRVITRLKDFSHVWLRRNWCQSNLVIRLLGFSGEIKKYH